MQVRRARRQQWVAPGQTIHTEAVIQQLVPMPRAYRPHSNATNDRSQVIWPDDSMMSLLPQFGTLLKSARQTVQACGQPDVKVQ
jgi:hypothetical protein